MEYGLSKPVAPMAVVPPARKQESPEPVVETELPEENTVKPADRSEDVRQSAHSTAEPAAQDAQRDLVRVNYRDSITNSIVFKAIDPDTGDVVQQVPDETLLRLRRFFEASEQAQQQNAQAVNQTA